MTILAAASHVLVIGGSGMLAGFCRRLAGEGVAVSVLARNPKRLDALVKSAAPGGIVPMAADYRDPAALDQTLSSAVSPADRTFCWVHDEIAPDAPLQIAAHVTGIFWHILGSAAANPGAPHILSGWRDRFATQAPHLDYRQIVLGFVLEGGRSRWLTDAEISDGVYNASQSAQALSIVGITDPWSRRP